MQEFNQGGKMEMGGGGNILNLCPSAIQLACVNSPVLKLKII
jgi:hypothetical protein